MNTIAKRFLAPLLLATSAALSVSASSGDSHWLADYDKAVEQARLEKKDLLVDFTGSDWCGWCKRLDQEVFSEPAFHDAATKDYVLVALDYPRDPAVKAKVPNPERNKELSEKHGIEGFPTIMLMTADGDVYGRTGYQAGGAQAYVEHLADLRKNGKPALERVLALERELAGLADDEARIAHCTRALVELEGPAKNNEAIVGRLALLARPALSLDASNARGLKLRATKTLLDASLYDAELHAAARALDAHNKAGLLERAVAGQLERIRERDDAVAFITSMQELEAAGPILDQERAVGLYTNAALLSEKLELERSVQRAYAKKALEYKPSNPKLVERLEELAAD